MAARFSDITLFQASGVLAGFQSRCARMSLAWWLLGSEGSLRSFAALVALSSASELTAKALMAPLGDFVDRRRLALICSLAGFALACLMLLLVMVDAKVVAFIAFLTVLAGFVTGTQEPLQSSIVPTLVPARRVAHAFEIQGVLTSITMLFGPGIAGVLLTAGGPRFAMAISVAFSAASLALRIPLLVAASEASVDARGRPLVRMWAGMMAEAAVAIYRVKPEFRLAVMASVINLFMYPFFLVLVPYQIKEGLRGAAWELGFLDAAFGIGILAASIKGISFIRSLIPRDHCIALGFGLLGACLFLTGLLLNFAGLSIAFFVGGIGLMLINVNASTVRVLATPPVYRHRMVAGVAFLSSLANPLGCAITQPIVALLGVRPTMQCYGAAVAACGLGVLFSVDLRRVMRLSDDEAKGVYALYYPNAFEENRN